MSDEAPKKKRGRPRKPRPLGLEHLTAKELRAYKARQRTAKKRVLLGKARQAQIKRNIWRTATKWKPDERPIDIIVGELCPTRIRAQYHGYSYDKGSYKALRGQFLHCVIANYREFARLKAAIDKVVQGEKWMDRYHEERTTHVPEAAHPISRDDDRRLGDSDPVD